MAAKPNLKLRQLKEGDVDKGLPCDCCSRQRHVRLHVTRLNACSPYVGFLDLLAQLTVVGEISRKQFAGASIINCVITRAGSRHVF